MINFGPPKQKVHLRVRWGHNLRDSFKRGRVKMTYTACNKNVRFDETTAVPLGALLTCPKCAVLSDWLVETDGPKRLTVRKARAAVAAMVRT